MVCERGLRYSSLITQEKIFIYFSLAKSKVLVAYATWLYRKSFDILESFQKNSASKITQRGVASKCLWMMSVLPRSLRSMCLAWWVWFHKFMKFTCISTHEVLIYFRVMVLWFLKNDSSFRPEIEAKSRNFFPSSSCKIRRKSDCRLRQSWWMLYPKSVVKYTSNSDSPLTAD